MKRLMLLSLLLFAYAEMNFGGVINISQPDGSTDLVLQHNYDIRWTASGLANPISIVLFKDGVRVGQIVRDLNKRVNTFNWRVGDYIGGRVMAAGTGYQIKVKEQGAATFQDSNRFAIVLDTDGDVIAPGRAELSIDQITRIIDSGDILPGHLLSLAVTVTNHSRVAADVYVATIGTAAENFVRRGSRETIGGSSSKVYALQFPVDASRIRGGAFNTTVFLVDANATGRTLFEVMYKDSNIADHNKEVSYPASSGLVKRNVSIARTMTADSANFWVPAPTFAWCSAALLASRLDGPASGAILMGYEEIFERGADPFPCHKKTRHRFWGAASFDQEYLRNMLFHIQKAVLKFKKTPARTNANNPVWNITGLTPAISVIECTAPWDPGFHVVSNPRGTPQLSGTNLGLLAEDAELDVTQTVIKWANGRLENLGFAFTQGLPPQGTMDSPYKFGAYIYSFELIVTMKQD